MVVIPGGCVAPTREDRHLDMATTCLGFGSGSTVAGFRPRKRGEIRVGSDELDAWTVQLLVSNGCV